MSLTLTVPTHLDGRNPIIGRYTARELVPVVAGIFGAAGVLGQPHVALVARLGEALTVLAVGLLVGLIRPGGRSLVAWGRLAATHLLAERSSAWMPPARPAATGRTPNALRPPHLVLRSVPVQQGSAGTEPVGPVESPTTTSWRRPATQHHPFVPVAIAADAIYFADGHYCAVLECSGSNVEAMDTEQQRALHAAYHAFLLGLAFPLQILLCSDPVDLTAYAARRAERLADRPLAVRRLGSADTAYMRRAVGRLGALDQHVYVVVPAGSPPALPVSAETGLPAFLRYRHHGRAAGRREGDSDGTRDVDRRLDERCQAVRDGLARAGIHAWRLDTAALRHLYYRRLCPRTARLQPFDRGHVAPLPTGLVLFARFDGAACTGGDEEVDDA